MSEPFLMKWPELLKGEGPHTHRQFFDTSSVRIRSLWGIKL